MSGFALYMISIIKDNARPRRKAFIIIKKHLRKHPPTSKPTENRRLLLTEKEEIRQEIQIEIGKDRIKNIIALTLTITSLILILYFGNLFFKFLIEFYKSN